MVQNGSILVPNTGSFGLQEASLKLSNLKKSQSLNNQKFNVFCPDSPA